jgi:ATP-dependent DNA helicase RecG
MFKESEKVELKESFAEWKEIIISLVAFANRHGGKVIVGVNDSGEFTYLQLGKKSIEDFVNKLKQNTDPVLYPSINVKEFGLGEYVEIEIPESDNKPVFAFDKAYIRTGKTNVKVSNALLRELISRYKTPDFDKLPSEVKYVKNIVDSSWIRTLNERYLKADTTEPEHILRSINVLADDRFTNAGYLCFANEINYFPNAIIRMARFKGETPGIFKFGSLTAVLKFGAPDFYHGS